MNATSDSRPDGGPSGSAQERTQPDSSRAAEEMRRHGEQFAASAKEHATQFASEQKEAGARHVETVARAVSRAADELEQSSPEMARYTRQVASSVSDASDAMKGRSIGELFDNVNRFARNEPAAFMGAAMVAGFALSRFLEASGRHHAAAPTPSARADGPLAGRSP